jgi:hypothetical protein
MTTEVEEEELDSNIFIVGWDYFRVDFSSLGLNETIYTML